MRGLCERLAAHRARERVHLESVNRNSVCTLKKLKESSEGFSKGRGMMRLEFSKAFRGCRVESCLAEDRSKAHLGT